MRNFREIAFRVRQEAANVRLLRFLPELSAAVAERCVTPLPFLPAPATVAAALARTGYAGEVLTLSEGLLAHRFPLLGLQIGTGPEIAWRRDYVSGIETGTQYFRRIPYLDPARAGDHKVIWELNRHQHLIVLAQARLLSGDGRMLPEITRQIDGWLAANPFQRGINWTSALEVAFRSLSWLWVWHLAGGDFEPGFRRRFLNALYQHGRHLEHNLSVYFSPNTHLLGEALALHALAVAFPEFPGSAAWRRVARQTVYGQMDTQVRNDGSHFEQSAYYHLYAVDMFLFETVLEPAPAGYMEKLGGMISYLRHLLGPSGLLPMFGDDDGGRFFHPYGERAKWPSQTLAAWDAAAGGAPAGPAPDLAPMAAWWFGCGRRSAPAPDQPLSSRLFADAGVATLVSGDTHVLFDCGPFGPFSAGHSHSDTLNLIIRRGSEEILIDPGTYTYVGDAQWRNRFRGSAAHNTVRVDGMDQARPVTPFSWRDVPAVSTDGWETSEALDRISGTCRYRGITHRRTVLFLKPDLLIVVDDLRYPPGTHLLEQFWHPGLPAVPMGPRSFAIGSATLTVGAGGTSLTEGGDYGWRAPAPGVKHPSPVLRVSLETTRPERLLSAFDFSPVRSAAVLSCTGDEITFAGARRISIRV